MARRPSTDRVVAVLLERHGQTYAAEAGIRLGTGGPAGLWELLVLTALLSARINAELAVQAARAVRKAGWTTAAKLAASTWDERVWVLNHNGYARYDERTATQLASCAELALDRYRGDLRRLRDGAGRDPDAERRALKEFTGIGDTGVDIFCREVQGVWGELAPFVDRRASDVARALGLPSDPAGLAALAGGDLPRFTSALVRCGLAKDGAGVVEAAGA